MITLFSQRNLRNLYDNYFCECLEFLIGRKTIPPEIFIPDNQKSKGINLRLSFYPHLSLRVGVVITLLGFLGSVIGIYSGWKYGHLLAMSFCVLSAVLGGMTLPRNIAPHMLLGVTMGAHMRSWQKNIKTNSSIQAQSDHLPNTWYC